MLIAKSPERAPFLHSYTSTLAQFSKRYRFWQTDWSKVDGFIGCSGSGPPLGSKHLFPASSKRSLKRREGLGVWAQDPPSMGLFPASSKRSLKRRPPLGVDPGALSAVESAGGALPPARLGSIASTCMFVQLAKGITQSRGALSSVLLDNSEHCG